MDGVKGVWIRKDTLHGVKKCRQLLQTFNTTLLALIYAWNLPSDRLNELILALFMRKD